MTDKSDESNKRDDLKKTIELMVERQKQDLLLIGRRLIPTLTSDDILQPNDYLELEHHPEFRYEEGVLAGMQALQMTMHFIYKEIY